MTTKLITENILTPEKFLSATEQASPFWGQPISDSGNDGAFRLLSKGTPADFSYSGTATSDGAADGTTVLDTILKVFGDDYFIGGTVAITDFLQDNGDYIEQDGPGRLALTTANKITITDLDDDEEVWLYIDKGAAHFAGDFEFHTQINCTATAGTDASCGLWALTNVVDTLCDIDVASGDYLAVIWLESAGSQYIVLAECNGGVVTPNLSAAVSVATEYYLVIRRDETIGTYGTLYCDIYSDAAHSVLVETLSVTLTEKQDFQYLFWMNSYESGSTGCAWDGTIQNFEIVESESKAISDFDQATGTITIAAFTYRVNIGTSFTLTVPFSSRDIRVELVAGGDAGNATFKWSHDGGTTYLGRDDPDQATWLADTIINTDANGNSTSEVIQAADGGWLVFYYEDGGPFTKCIKSTDKGLTWTSPVVVGTGEVASVVIINNGRLIVTQNTNSFKYSDDDGVTWSTSWVITTLPASLKMCVFDNNTILGVYSSGSIVYFIKSIDRGMNWSSPIIVASDANTQRNPDIIIAHNGNFICVYESDEDSLNDFEIKCKISDDNGVTWGSVIDVIDFSGDLSRPSIDIDINGEIYCVAQDSGSASLVFTVSSDDGLIWNSATAKNLLDKANAIWSGRIRLMDGHFLVCVYNDIGDTSTGLVRRGIWEAFSANACPIAINAQEQKLICDTVLIWHGGEGIVADKWSFTPEYQYTMENLITDSPSKPWRSTQDNIACNIVMDLGANERFYADGIAFFGCNVRALDFQMNATDSWGSPSIDEAVSFQVTTGTVDSISGNIIEDSSLMTSYKDHELSKRLGGSKRKFLRMTSGTDSGITWEILDNVGSYIFLDMTAANNIAGTDTFEIFQSFISVTFTGGNYRYMRINIAAHHTADDYYQIGVGLPGRVITLTKSWSSGYKKDFIYDIEILRTPKGGLIPIVGADQKYRFGLNWRMSSTARKEMASLLTYLEGKNLVLIPDSSDLLDCYLVKHIGNVSQTQRRLMNDIFDYGTVILEEVL